MQDGTSFPICAHMPSVQKLALRGAASHTSRMLRLPRTALHAIEMTRDDGRHRAAICVSAVDEGTLQARAAEFLHADEQRQWRGAGMPKRQAEFLRGRYCAKAALGLLHPQLAAREAFVASGVFGQPIVRSPGHAAANTQVSIAHSERWAAAVAFDEGHPMAIDLEAHDARRAETIRGEATAEERAGFAEAGIAEPQSLTLIWAAREALAKVLRTGLMAPLHLYEVGRVENAAGTGTLTCEYRHFAQYKSWCAVLPEFAFAIALPRKSALQLDCRALTVDLR